jgi:hypothetical protein
MEVKYSIWHDKGDDLTCTFFRIFDGHWGRESVMLARKHLMEFIVNHKHHKGICSDKDEDIWAIRSGF